MNLLLFIFFKFNISLIIVHFSYLFWSILKHCLIHRDSAGLEIIMDCICGSTHCFIRILLVNLLNSSFLHNSPFWWFFRYNFLLFLCRTNTSFVYCRMSDHWSFQEIFCLIQYRLWGSRIFGKNLLSLFLIRFLLFGKVIISVSPRLGYRVRRMKRS